MEKTASYIIPILNEERTISRCLASISRQSVDHSMVEVVIADAMSEDKTIELAESWGKRSGISVKIVRNARKLAEFGKAEALRVASGRYIVLLDADNEIGQTDWLEKALDALSVFPDAFGFESHYLKIPGGYGPNNYLTACLHINDPLAWAIAPRPPILASAQKGDLTYREYRLPAGYPCGTNGFVFRREALTEFVGSETFEEGQVALKLAVSGDAHFTMIDGYGVYHHYVSSFRQFLAKRAKIALKHTTRSQTRDTWVRHGKSNVYWAAMLNAAFVPPLVYSLWRTMRDREPLWLYHAPMAFLTTLAYAVEWFRIRISGKRAWQ